MAISRDITERKRMEKALLRTEKLKALGEMAAGVAHDFNNVLAIILGNAQLLEKGVDFILSKPFDYNEILREVNAALKSKKR